MKQIIVLLVGLVLMLVGVVDKSTANEISIFIGDKDRYNQGLPPATGPDVANIDNLDYAPQPFINRTDSIMNDNYPMQYDFTFSPLVSIVSAAIVINALDVETMGDLGDTPVIPLVDGIPLDGQALHSVPKPWGSPGPSDSYATETTFNLSDVLFVLNDGHVHLEFPAGNHGDNVAFDFVELKIIGIGYCIGDKDRYNQGLPPATGPDVANIDNLDYAPQPFINRTDSIMNDNYPMQYDFTFSPLVSIVSAAIVINALDVETMGDLGDTPVIPLVDGIPLDGQALHSVPKPWGSPGPSDSYATETVFDLSSVLLSAFNDGHIRFQFPPGHHGDNVAFDFIELNLFLSMPTGISEFVIRPGKVSLQSYPNPCNPITTIAYYIPSPGPATISVYDIKGRLIQVLVNEEKPAGRSSVIWDGCNKYGLEVASGIYFVRIESSGEDVSKKVILLK